MARKLLLLRTREYNRVQQSCMGWPNDCNIMQHRGKQKKCCIVQHLFSEKFDHYQTSYNKIQHDKTRYNKVAKRVQHFIKHQSCMMLYEMLYSFGRGLKPLSQNRLSCTRLFLNSLIRKLPLWFQHNSTKTSCDKNRILLTGLKGLTSRARYASASNQ